MVGVGKISFSSDDTRSPSNLLFAATLASLSYKPQLEIEAGLVEIGYSGTDVIFFKTDLISCFIVRWEDFVFISFKGSESWREWLNNLNAWPEATAQGRLHAGWLYAISRYGPILYQLIKSDILLGKKIVLTGHSRGGALANLFAGVLVLNGHCPHSVYTYCAPMVGDKQFVNGWQRMPKQPMSRGVDISSDLERRNNPRRR
jgi:hypothetical protein